MRGADACHDVQRHLSSALSSAARFSYGRRGVSCFTSCDIEGNEVMELGCTRSWHVSRRPIEQRISAGVRRSVGTAAIAELEMCGNGFT